MKNTDKKTIKNVIMLSLVIASTFYAGVSGAEEDWICATCNSANVAENNFCGYCGSPKPEESLTWICPSCGKENDKEFNFCVNCGAEKASAGQAGAEASASTDVKPYAYGQHMLYWDGYTYVTGDDGIYRIDANNQFDRILGIDSVANGIFAVGDDVYFMKYDIEGGSDFLYVYDIERDDCDILCMANNGSILIGADEAAVYFLEPTNASEYNDGKDLIRYHLKEDEKETVASGVGTAQFWNGGLVISGAASDISPVQLMVLGADGNSGLVDRNCSQNFYIDGSCLYYIKYNMTTDVDWDKAYLCCLDQTGNKEILCMEGNYITPYIVGTVSGNIVVSFYRDGKLQYIQVNPADGSWGEMELPEGASSISIFYDEYGNRFYYANSAVYIWKGSEYREVASVAEDGIMLGVSGNYAFCWRYNAGKHPSLFQFPIS